MHEEDFEYRHHTPIRERNRPRRRHGATDFMNDVHARSSSTGPLAFRPRMKDDHDFEQVPRGIEQEKSELSARKPNSRERLYSYQNMKRNDPVKRSRRKSRSRLRDSESHSDEYISRDEGEESSDDDYSFLQTPAKYTQRTGDGYRGRFSYERQRSRQMPKDQEEFSVRGDGRGGFRRKSVIEQDSNALLRAQERSPSPVSYSSRPPLVRTPPVHKDVVTHHKHIDHGREQSGWLC